MQAQFVRSGTGQYLPSRTPSTLAAGVTLASLVGLAGCGMFSSDSSHGSQSAQGTPPAATTADGQQVSGSQAAGTPGSTTQPNAIGSMAHSAGTDAWINPQARQEPGDNNITATFNLQQVTFAQEGADFDPAISRDGSRIVFASTQHRPTADLYVKTVTGRTITQLTNDPAEDGTPDVSPDGGKVAFASNRNGNWDIYVMPITGGKAVQVTADESDELHPSWSPDGTQLVFSRMGPTSGRWEMWVTDATKSGNGTFIGYGLFPRWCPKTGTGAEGSDRIVFQLGRERGQRSFAIWTVDYADTQSSNPTLIASSSSSALINPTWSPDGAFIVYSAVPTVDNAAAGPSPAAELWLASVTAEASVKLTGGDLRAIRPAWGPRNRLYFVSDRNATENIWSIDLAQSLASIDETSLAGATASMAPRVQSPVIPTTNKPAKAPAKTASATKTQKTPTPRSERMEPDAIDEEAPASRTADAGDEEQQP
ncbi:MAG: TolB family protein [Phycisphaerales bacterium]|nr:TolB family protein [Phycisphaerales bacterium]